MFGVVLSKLSAGNVRLVSSTVFAGFISNGGAFSMIGLVISVEFVETGMGGSLGFVSGAGSGTGKNTGLGAEMRLAVAIRSGAGPMRGK